MSVGIHSGELTLVLVGDPSVHRELVVCGPTATRTVQLEAAARTDEIRLSAEAADLLPAGCVDRGGALPLLTRAPDLDDIPVAPGPANAAEADLASGAARRRSASTCSPATCPRTIARSPSRSCASRGPTTWSHATRPERLVAALDECVRLVQHAAQRHGVTFLESDVDANGVRIMLVAGAPRSGEHNEDRLLRAVQHILGAPTPLPIQIGIDRGAVFTGVLGPSFCRTYSVKGDAVNVAARLAASARPGEALVTLSTLEHSGARFEHEPLPPVQVKGKSAPIELARLGGSVLPRPESTAAEGELIGRDAELASLRSTVEAASAGNGGLVEIVGEPGIGKSRLAQAVLADLDVPSYLDRLRRVRDAHAVLGLPRAVRVRAAAPGRASGRGRAARRRGRVRPDARWPGCRCSPGSSTSTWPPLPRSTRSTTGSGRRSCRTSPCGAWSPRFPNGRCSSSRTSITWTTPRPVCWTGCAPRPAAVVARARDQARRGRRLPARARGGVGTAGTPGRRRGGAAGARDGGDRAADRAR